MTAVTDFGQFTSLRAAAKQDEAGTLREVAEQFEALFVQNMLKSMRDASFGDPIFGDEGGSELFRDMFDQQIATDIAGGRGIGLADLLVRQMGGDAAATEAASIQAPAPVHRVKEKPPVWEDAKQFVADILPFARATAEKLGVTPLAVLSQAALETGWGRHVMQDGNGQNSLNLFGIKAGSTWSGERTVKSTLEYESGIAEQRKEPFRVYHTLKQSFDDYARLLGDTPRYSDVTGKQSDISGFAEALQGAGYATDPNYAEKIRSVAGGDQMRRVLGALKESDLLSLSLNVR
ncbi:MAG: glucosaminidase domain-containing protein [Pseudomonadota bacterium]